jgi:hypothetical protein
MDFTGEPDFERETPEEKPSQGLVSNYGFSITNYGQIKSLNIS